MKKLFLIISLVIACGFNSFAQDNMMSIEVGGDVVTSFTRARSLSDRTTVQGFFAAFNYDYGITDVFSVASETGFQTALHMEKTISDLKYVDLSLQEVVAAKFGFDLGSYSRLFFYAGPGLSVGLSSKLKDIRTGVEKDFYKDKNYNRLNLLAAAGVGVVLNSTLCLKFEYNYGLLNTCNLPGMTEHTQRLMLGISYCFGD